MSFNPGRYFNERPIKFQLVAIMLIASTLLVAGASFFGNFFSEKLLRESAIENAINLGHAQSQNFLKLILHDSSSVAADATAALASFPDITDMFLYDSNGVVVYQYHHQTKAQVKTPPTLAPEQTVAYVTNGIEVSMPSQYEGMRFGYVYFRLSTDRLDHSLRTQRFIAVAAVLLLIPIGFLVASFMQKYFSKPIIDLTDYVRQVRLDHDFTRRIAGVQHGEIGELYEGFNNLLEQIQSSTKALRDQQYALDQSAIISIGDPSGCIEYVNNKLVEATGFSREELIGKNHRIFNSGFHDSDFFATLWRTISNGHIWRGEVRNKCKDGRFIWLDTTIVPFLDNSGLPYQYLVIRYDISDRKEGEERLKELNASLEQRVSDRTLALQTAMKQLGDAQKIALVGSFEWDPISADLEWSDQHYRLWGLEPQSKKPTYELFEQGVHHEDIALVRDHLTNAIKEGGLYECEHRVVWPDNTCRYIRGRAWVTLNSEGQAIHMSGTVQDVTESKNAESELRAAMARAEQANFAKSAFLANMSHEIRTPMNGILGMAYLIRRGGVSPKQIEQLDKLDVAGRHLLEIINAILDLSKIEAGKFIIEETDLCLGAVLANIASMLGPTAEAKHILIKVEGDQLPNKLIGDPTRLQQALLNYASNAVKFTERGHVSLRTRLEEETPDDVLVRFEVEDTGIGIAPEVADKLFNAFEQADNSTTRKYGGTGLGLVITKKIAELMGGMAGVKSIPRQGSTFWFTARFKKSGKDTEELVQADLQLAGSYLQRDYSGCRLLLVEDEPINREVALEILHDVWPSVDVAENGAEAVERVKSTAYDLILMDMQMPVMDGLDATRQIRALATGKDITILAMTANAFAEDRQRCMDAGMNDFIAKPVDPDTLYSTILRCLPVQAASESAGSGLTPANSPEGASIDVMLERLSGMTGLDIEAGLRTVRGKPETYLRLLRLFAEEHAKDVKKIRDCIDRDLREDAERCAHSLKGASGTLGATGLQQIAASLQFAIHHGENNEQLALLNALEATLPPFLDHLNEVLDS